MSKRAATVLLLIASTAAWAKTSEPATLKDVQPTNTPVAKKAHQQFDFTLMTSSRSYVCRTQSDKSVNVTDFVVGSSVAFEIGGKHGEIKMNNGKKAKCDIVRVENAYTPTQ